MRYFEQDGSIAELNIPDTEGLDLQAMLGPAQLMKETLAEVKVHQVEATKGHIQMSVKILADLGSDGGRVPLFELSPSSEVMLHTGESFETGVPVEDLQRSKVRTLNVMSENLKKLMEVAKNSPEDPLVKQSMNARIATTKRVADLIIGAAEKERGRQDVAPPAIAGEVTADEVHDAAAIQGADAMEELAEEAGASGEAPSSDEGIAEQAADESMANGDPAKDSGQKAVAGEAAESDTSASATEAADTIPDGPTEANETVAAVASPEAVDLGDDGIPDDDWIEEASKEMAATRAASDTALTDATLRLEGLFDQAQAETAVIADAAERERATLGRFRALVDIEVSERENPGSLLVALLRNRELSLRYGEPPTLAELAGIAPEFYGAYTIDGQGNKIKFADVFDGFVAVVYGDEIAEQAGDAPIEFVERM